MTADRTLEHHSLPQLSKAIPNPQGRHQSFDNFKLVTTMPYKANTMFGFLRTDSSWHGVLPLQEKDLERNSISFQIMIDNLSEL